MPDSPAVSVTPLRTTQVPALEGGDTSGCAEAIEKVRAQKTAFANQRQAMLNNFNTAAKAFSS